MPKLETGRRSRDPRPEKSSAEPSRGRGKSPSKGRRILLIIVLSLAVCAVVAAATLSNGSSRGLDIQKGDNIQYIIESHSGNNITSNGSLMIEVTGVTSSSFEITYAITLENKTTRTVVGFPGASGDWRSNIANVMNKLSGSSSSASISNQTQLVTIYGVKEAIGYTITTTTKSGIGLYYEYWLGLNDKTPLLLVLQYGNGDVVTGTLMYTSIAEFQS